MRTLLAVVFVAVFATHADGQTVAYAEGGPAGFSDFAGAGTTHFTWPAAAKGSLPTASVSAARSDSFSA